MTTIMKLDLGHVNSDVKWDFFLFYHDNNSIDTKLKEFKNSTPLSPFLSPESD